MVSLGTIGPFNLDDGLANGSTSDDYFFGVKDPNGIVAIKLSHPAAGGTEMDHVQYGDLAKLTATWDDGLAIQGSGGGLDPALHVGLEIGPIGGTAPIVTTPDAQTTVLTYSGLDPNEQLQINVASYGLPFYPPDPIKVVGNQIQVEFDDGGTMATLTIDITSSSGGLLDPLSVVGFNPQPEPPGALNFAFNPAPSGATEALSIEAPLVGGVGPAGATTLTLTLQVLDDGLVALPASPVASVILVPMMGPLLLGMLASGLGGVGWVAAKRRAARRTE